MKSVRRLGAYMDSRTRGDRQQCGRCAGIRRAGRPNAAARGQRKPCTPSRCHGVSRGCASRLNETCPSRGKRTSPISVIPVRLRERSIRSCRSRSSVREIPLHPPGGAGVFLSNRRRWRPNRGPYLDSASAMVTTRVAIWSSAALVASSSSFWLSGPVMWLTPYGFPSANLRPSV